MFKLDPEIAAPLGAMTQAGSQAQPALNDLTDMREVTNAGLTAMFARLPDAANVRASSYEVPTADGSSISLTWYEKGQVAQGAAVVYVHGGGMIAGSAVIYDRLLRHYVELSGVSFLAVGYRLAPEHRQAGLAHDVMTTIGW